MSEQKLIEGRKGESRGMREVGLTSWNHTIGVHKKDIPSWSLPVCVCVCVFNFRLLNEN